MCKNTPRKFVRVVGSNISKAQPIYRIFQEKCKISLGLAMQVLGLTKQVSWSHHAEFISLAKPCVCMVYPSICLV